jgi:AmiR/NasT family two-component response regulator
VSEDSKAELRRLFDGIGSRKQIEVAVGVLMGLRGYSSDEAVKTLSMRSTKPVLAQATSGAR